VGVLVLGNTARNACDNGARRRSGGDDRGRVSAADVWPFFEGLLIAGLVGATLAAAVSLLLARRIARPVRRVAGASRRLAGGGAPALVPLEGPEELRVLAASFNELAEQLARAVSNLVENALRLTPAGGGVRVAARAGVVRVTDTGPGLRPEELAHAFERFYLHDRYGRTRRVGTGLGLAIVKELTEAMGGRVSVRSEPGEGAEFVVRLRHVSAQSYASGLASSNRGRPSSGSSSHTAFDPTNERYDGRIPGSPSRDPSRIEISGPSGQLPPNTLEPQIEQNTFAAPPSGR
jgi:HAMP domain-containing protein